MRLQRPHRAGSPYDECVTPRISVWDRSRSAVPAQAFAAGLALVLAIATEYRRAVAAAHHYERLKRAARAPDDPAASPARRVYVEFYSGRQKTCPDLAVLR